MEPQSVAVGVLPGMKFKTTWRNVEQDISKYMRLVSLIFVESRITILNNFLILPEVLTDNGITDVFCLCKQSELSYFRVRELFDAYHSKDIRVHHYPIQPDLSPDYKDIRTVLVDLWNTLLNGSKVYIQLVLSFV